MITPADQHPESHDRIVLTGLRAYGYHGVFDHEKAQGQDFYVDLIVRGPVAAAAKSDDLADTVDYGALADAAAEIVAGEPFDLIETLAVTIADRLLEYCSDIEVTVHKPQAPIAREFRDVAVTVRRVRGAAGTPGAGASGADGRGAAAESAELDGPAGAVSGEAALGADCQGGTAVLSLGANLGDPLEQIELALESLQRHPRITVLERSSAFVTAPVGGVEQPDFFNVSAVVSTTLPARELLAVCQGIEAASGRTREVRWGPRTLDIDLIRFTPGAGDIDDPAAELTLDTDVLTLPHPRAHERAFVLAPWAEIRPQARIAVGAGGQAMGAAGQPMGTAGMAGSRAVGDLAAGLSDQQVVRAADQGSGE